MRARQGQARWCEVSCAAQAPLTFKGVVFNEMKGVYSSPDSMNQRHTQQAIFPDNTYAVDSGGDPVDIPNLSFDECAPTLIRVLCKMSASGSGSKQMDVADQLAEVLCERRAIGDPASLARHRCHAVSVCACITAARAEKHEGSSHAERGKTLRTTSYARRAGSRPSTSGTTTRPTRASGSTATTTRPSACACWPCTWTSSRRSRLTLRSRRSRSSRRGAAQLPRGAMGAAAVTHGWTVRPVCSVQSSLSRSMRGTEPVWQTQSSAPVRLASAVP